MPNKKDKSVVQKKCKHHGMTDYILECNGTRYRCKKCRSKSVSRHRIRRKKQLVELHGGKCVICGYCKCQQALQFHHVNKAEKSFTISQSVGLCKNKEQLIAEASKCILVCANCHAEIEAGIINIENDIVTGS